MLLETKGNFSIIEYLFRSTLETEIYSVWENKWEKNVLQEYNIETKIIINSSESQHKTKVNFLVNN